MTELTPPNMSGPHRRLIGGGPIPDLSQMRADQREEQRRLREGSQGRHPSAQQPSGQPSAEQMFTAVMEHQQSLGFAIREVLAIMTEANMGLPHVPVAGQTDIPAVWGVFCLACTAHAGTYTYPCKMLPLPGESDEGDQARSAWPPQQLVEVQGASEPSSSSSE